MDKANPEIWLSTFYWRQTAQKIILGAFGCSRLFWGEKKVKKSSITFFLSVLWGCDPPLKSKKLSERNFNYYTYIILLLKHYTPVWKTNICSVWVLTLEAHNGHEQLGKSCINVWSAIMIDFQSISGKRMNGKYSLKVLFELTVFNSDFYDFKPTSHDKNF